MTTIKAIRLASLVTAINILVASSLSIAAVIRPQYDASQDCALNCFRTCESRVSQGVVCETWRPPAGCLARRLESYVYGSTHTVYVRVWMLSGAGL
jgi:hypothetical protein